jgi:hypothetical protein
MGLCAGMAWGRIMSIVVSVVAAWEKASVLEKRLSITISGRRNIICVLLKDGKWPQVDFLCYTRVVINIQIG